VIGPEPFESPDAQVLVRAQQAELRELDGRGDIGPVRVGAMFEEPDGVFLVVRDEEGSAIGCGGLARFDAARGELKRMYVVPDARGSGLGRRLLVALEGEALRLGYRGLVLETGEAQAEALRLYTSAGYEPIPCYGSYAGQPISRCFEKRLERP
jgi:GNAT superfamily N-acetyltransferase